MLGFQPSSVFFPNCLVLPNLCPLQLWISVLGRKDWNQSFSSAVVVHLPRACAPRDATPLTTVVQSAYQAFLSTLCSFPVTLLVDKGGVGFDLLFLRSILHENHRRTDAIYTFF